MDSKINSIINQYPQVETAVSIIDLNGGKTYNYGESNTKYIAASVSKLLSATLFLHGVESGTYSMDMDINGEPARKQLERMIVNSDNGAWQAFNDMLGHDALQAWAAQIGLRNYSADDNELSSQDVSVLLAALYGHKILSGASTNLLLSYMKEAEGIDYVREAVPAKAKVYQKAGWLDDRIHVASIIDDGKDPYVLVIFTKTKGNYDTAAGKDIFKSITKATTSAFIE